VCLCVHIHRDHLECNSDALEASLHVCLEGGTGASEGKGQMTQIGVFVCVCGGGGHAI